MNVYLFSLALGFLPFAVGVVMNFALMNLAAVGMILMMLDILFLPVWFLLCRKVCGRAPKPWLAAVLAHLPALAALATLLIPRLLGQGYPGGVGVYAQYFFLPLLTISTQSVMLFTNHIGTDVTFTVAFLLMLAAGLLAVRKQKEK